MGINGRSSGVTPAEVAGVVTQAIADHDPPVSPLSAWPVGAVFIAIVSTSPATLLGGGTWLAFGTGRMLVGRDPGDTDFDTAEETGGAKTVALTSAEMPSHTHTQDAHGHTQDAHTHTQDSHNHTQNAHGHTQDSHTHGMISLTAATGSVASYEHGTVDASSTASAESGALTGATVATNQTTVATNQAATATNQNATATNQTTVAVNQSTGGGGAHANMPPYIVVYMWKRTA